MMVHDVDIPFESSATLTVPAEIGELGHVNEFIHSELDRLGCPMRAQLQIDIAIEELFVNVCCYAYPEGPGSATIRCICCSNPTSTTIKLIDSGVPFNPVVKPDVALASSIDDVPVGGLGILMAKRSVDEMSYERSDGKNIVTLVKRW